MHTISSNMAFTKNLSFRKRCCAANVDSWYGELDDLEMILYAT